jgi:hypothetical protein
VTVNVSRIEIDIDWFGGLRDRLGRLTIDTLKNWLTPILAVIAVGLSTLSYMSSRAPGPGPPAPGKVDPAPKPEVRPPADPAPDQAPPLVVPASPLGKAAKDYVDTLPKAFTDLADAVESGELKDKAAAVAFAKKHSAGMAAALDQVFSPGVDRSGKITDPAKIAGPLRQAAKELGPGRARMTDALPEAL